MAETQISNVQEQDVDASVLNPAGLPVAVESVTFESTDESIITVEQDPTNPLRATIRSTGIAGNAQVLFAADADLDEGELPVLGFFDVEVTESGEFRVEFIFGEPRRRE